MVHLAFVNWKGYTYFPSLHYFLAPSRQCDGFRGVRPGTRNSDGIGGSYRKTLAFSRRYWLIYRRHASFRMESE